MSVKVRFNERGKDYFPEYEECRRIAIDMDMPLQDVHRIIQNEATERLL